MARHPPASPIRRSNRSNTHEDFCRLYYIASYKPILEEVEKILAEAGLDAEEMKRVGAGGGVGAAAGSRNRR